jgi:hypothetical protein
MLSLLKRHLPWIDRGINRVVYWSGFSILVWSLMTTIASWLPSAANFSVAIFIGLGATCGIALTASAVLVAIRFFRPLHPISRPGAQPAVGSVPAIDEQMRHDVLRLLHFSVIKTTADLLENLLDESPPLGGVGLEKWFEDNPRPYNSAQTYFAEVRKALEPLPEQLDIYVSLMEEAEAEADRQIRLTPPDKRLHEDHLILRQYAVAHLQFNRTRLFLIKEKANTKHQLLAMRPILIHRLRIEGTKGD